MRNPEGNQGSPAGDEGRNPTPGIRCDEGAREPEGNLEEMLGEVPPDKAPGIKAAMIESSLFHGPLPPPSLFNEYEKVLPGAADRILTMAEREQEHRIWWEKKDLDTESRYALSGMYLGSIGLFLLIVGAVFSVYQGSIEGALVFLGASVLSVLGRFLSSRWGRAERHKMEEEDK